MFIIFTLAIIPAANNGALLQPSLPSYIVNVLKQQLMPLPDFINID